MPWPKPLSSVLKNALSKSIQYGAEILHQRIPYSHENPYLEGIFAPERQEHFSTNLKVEGQIPAELDGALMRIGPNPINVKNPRNYHWFTGDGMLHAFRVVRHIGIKAVISVLPVCRKNFIDHKFQVRPEVSRMPSIPMSSTLPEKSGHW